MNDAVDEVSCGDLASVFEGVALGKHSNDCVSFA